MRGASGLPAKLRRKAPQKDGTAKASDYVNGYTVAVDGGWLAPDALVVLEESANAEILLPEQLTQEDARRYGDTQFLFLRFTP